MIDLLLAENRTVLAGNIVIMRRSERQEMWSGVARDVTQPMVMRLKATELLGKAQADFVEVRTPPVVTDNTGEAKLMEVIVEVVRRRKALDAIPVHIENVQKP